MYHFILLFKVRICTCQDKPGEDTMCPKHGLGAAMIRGIVLFVILTAVVLLFGIKDSLGF